LYCFDIRSSSCARDLKRFCERQFTPVGLTLASAAFCSGRHRMTRSLAAVSLVALVTCHSAQVCDAALSPSRRREAGQCSSGVVVTLGEEAGEAATGSENEHRSDDEAKYGDDYPECCVKFVVSIRAEKTCSCSNCYQRV